MKSAPAVAFDYRPSRLLIAGIAAALLLAMLALSLCGMAIAAKIFFAVLALIYTVIATRQLFRSSPRRAVWHAAGYWRIAFADSEETVAELVGAAIRGTWIVLNFRTGNGRRINLILAPDNSDAETRRLLRVRLSRNADLSRA
jgi:toxin CptA